MTANIQPFQPNAPASAQALSLLIALLPNPLPDGYTAFLRRANGGEGFIGERYVRLWTAEELIDMNRGYNVAQFFPDLFFIGTDGGVFEVPFIGLPCDARMIADSFESFLSS